jgi:hypothetical protein
VRPRQGPWADGIFCIRYQSVSSNLVIGDCVHDPSKVGNGSYLCSQCWAVLFTIHSQAPLFSDLAWCFMRIHRGVNEPLALGVLQPQQFVEYCVSSSCGSTVHYLVPL